MPRVGRFPDVVLPSMRSPVGRKREPQSTLSPGPLRPQGRPPIAVDQGAIAVHNATGKPDVWVKTADEILASIARVAQRALKAHGAH